GVAECRIVPVCASRVVALPQSDSSSPPGRLARPADTLLSVPKSRHCSQTTGKEALMNTPSLTARFGLPVIGMLSCIATGSFARDDDHRPILDRLHRISAVASTVPANGDVNPYGVAMIHRTEGRLKKGHILVSNFNNSANLQGTGTTIVDVAPNGSVG